MISTVTTSTVSTVTTAAMAGWVMLVGIIVLLVLLAQKEITRAGNGPRYRTLYRAANFAIAPLLIAFVLIVVVRIIEYLP